ncbi:MAG: DUF2382 domain-containing protein [Microcoleaceae cyanobacterium]
MNGEKEAITNDKTDDFKKDIAQNLKVYDTQKNLLGDVKHIIRDENNKLQIVFSLPGQEKPLFRVSKQAVRKVNLEQNYIIIFITESMNKELLKHSHDSSEWTQGDFSEESIDTSESAQETVDNNSVLDEATIRLLEERLKIERSSKKVGEVVVRKVVETKTVEVPVYQEKLIVEQISGDKTENIAEIDLSSEVIESRDLQGTFGHQNGLSVHGEFVSLEAASEILKAISLQKDPGCQKIKIELVVNDSQKQQDYQAMFDRCTE